MGNPIVLNNELLSMLTADHLIEASSAAYNKSHYIHESLGSNSLLYMNYRDNEPIFASQSSTQNN